MDLKKITAAVCTILSLFFVFDGKAYAAPSQDRLSGKDRYGTSVKISQNGWKTTSDYAVIAYGEDFPDALTAAPLAKKYNAPILLTGRDSLDKTGNYTFDAKISDELKRLQVKKVFIVGGPGVVSENVVNEIKAIVNNGKQIEVERFAGSDRFKTSLEVAKKVGVDKGIVVTTGLDFADALSVSPIAAAKEMPIILVDKDTMDQDVKAYLNGANYLVKEGVINDAPKAYIIGGNGVVGQGLENLFSNKKRLAGIDAYETNISVLKEFEADIDYSTAYIATRNDFPDALSGSALASIKVSPIILTGDTPSKATSAFMNEKLDSIKDVRVLGGEGVVKPQAMQRLVTDIAELKELLQANAKTSDIKSMESNGGITLKLDAQGLPQETQVQLDAILPLISNTKITMNTKTNANDDKTSVKSSVDMSMDSFMGPFDMSFWMDMDMSKETPSFKEIIKINPLIASSLPEEYAGKEYMVMDSTDGVQNGAAPFDYKELTQFSKEFQDEFVKFMTGYMADGNNLDFIAYKGEQSITTPDGTRNAKVYEVKLNNQILKQILDYLNTEGEDISSIKDLNIFGDKGVVLTYYISDGYIVAQNALIDLHLDLAKLDSVLGSMESGTDPAQKLQGIINLELNIDSKTFNINKNVNVVLPELNASNSFKVRDLENQ